jgi:RNA methyltransferase, TrmH family
MPKAESITSAANPLLKDVRRALARDGLTEHGWCVAEGFHLLDEALRSECEVKAVLAAESVRHRVEADERLSGVKLLALPDSLLQGLSSTETSQGVIALVKPREWKMADVFGEHALVVVLDGVQDPGNAGTIVRTAEAFGATGAMFVKGTASPHNPKTMRAAAGSLFRLPYVFGIEEVAASQALRQRAVTLYIGVPVRKGSGALMPSAADFKGDTGLAIGSEAHGVGEALRTGAVEVSIPTGGVESLNAAVAAGILLYEARRQRTGA